MTLHNSLALPSLNLGSGLMSQNKWKHLSRSAAGPLNGSHLAARVTLVGLIIAENARVKRGANSKIPILPSINRQIQDKIYLFWSTTCRLCQLTYTAVPYYCLLSVWLPCDPALSSFCFYRDSSSLPFSCWSWRPSAELPSFYTSTGCWLYFSQRSLLNLIIIVWVFLTHLIVQTLGAFLYKHTLQLYHTGAQFICLQAGLACSQFISWSQLQEEKGKVLIRAFLTATNETAGGSSVERNWGISIQKFGGESPWNSCTVYFLLTRRLHKWSAALKRLYNALGLVYSHMCHNLAH